MNKTIQLGRLTRDIETKTLPSGTVIATFSIANNHKYKKQDGTVVDEPNFFECSAMGKTAENIAKYFSKGQRILVVGRLKQETWDDKDTGNKRSKIVIMVEEFDFIESGERDENKPRRTEYNHDTGAVNVDEEIPF